MTKKSSMNLWEILILMISQVIWIHFREWEAVVVCCPRRGMRMIRISYLKFSECQWQREVVVVRRGVKIYIDILATTTIDFFGSVRLCLWLPVREEIHIASSYSVLSEGTVNFLVVARSFITHSSGFCTLIFSITLSLSFQLSQTANLTNKTTS